RGLGRTLGGVEFPFAGFLRECSGLGLGFSVVAVDNLRPQAGAIRLLIWGLSVRVDCRTPSSLSTFGRFGSFLTYMVKRHTDVRTSLDPEGTHMKAAIVTAAGTLPTFGDFRTPAAQQGLELVNVTAAALSNLTKGRAAGSHYSSENQYPFVPGVDGVGTTPDGHRVYFAMPEAPFGAMAEQTLVDPRRTIFVPDSLDDITAAALANPGMSCWAALVERAHFQPGETVLINGATGSSGTVAVQVAKHLGAKKVIATGRNDKSGSHPLFLRAAEAVVQVASSRMGIGLVSSLSS